MSKKKAKKLLNILKIEKEKNHPGTIDTVWLGPEELKILNSELKENSKLPAAGLELLKGGMIRITDGGDLLCDITEIFSSSTLDTLAEKLEERL